MHSTILSRQALFPSIAALVLSATCAPRTTVPQVPTTTPSLIYSGRVVYDARALTAQGYGRAPQRRPARWVVVRALDASGAVLATANADGTGAFRLECARPAATLVARASIQRDRSCVSTRNGTQECTEAMHIDVASDRVGTRVYEVRQPVQAPSTTISLAATLAEPDALGGAFHILDVLATGMETVHRWSNRPLAPFFVIWAHASGTEWSYYRGERPAGSGRFALELMGGEPGRLNVTDADEHDEYIILHEFGHFVFDQLSTDSSIGGMHPASVLTDPGVAWEEGRATWFAAAVLQNSRYRDAVGIEPDGQLRQDDELERLPADALRGLGSQRSVEELLWDLSDGTIAEGTTVLADQDSDGIALGPARVFQAMLALRTVPNVFPSIRSFLRHLVTTGALTEAQAQHLLLSPTPQRIPWFSPGQTDTWPMPITAGVPVQGKVDGRSNPAPSGGRANPVNGYDAVRTYRLLVPVRSQLQAVLQIRGSGRAADHTNATLELRDNRANLIVASETTNPTESIQRTLDPGMYLLYVRDAGDGNTAEFTLRATLTPQTH